METLTDAALLEAFTSREDEGAFGELMSRHGALVYRACHRLLGDPHEAEDAAQAVFVVLARKAGGLRKDDLSAWLYRVAHHVAAEAVRKRMRRTRREEDYADRETVQAGEKPDEAADAAVLQAMDAELMKLPGRYREAVILRHLKDHSQEDAARLAGCSVGALAVRVHRGIEQLRKRLGKIGLATSASALVGLLTSEASAAVPETLLPSILATVKLSAATTAAATGASFSAIALAKGAMQVMFWNQVKVAAMVGLGAAVLGSGGAMMTLRAADSGGKPAAMPTSAGAGKAEIEKKATQPGYNFVVKDMSPAAALDEISRISGINIKRPDVLKNAPPLSFTFQGSSARQAVDHVARFSNPELYYVITDEGIDVAVRTVCDPAKVIIPEVDFRNASLYDVMKMLHESSVAFGEPHAKAFPMQIAIRNKEGELEGFIFSEVPFSAKYQKEVEAKIANTDFPRITFTARHKSVLDTLRSVAHLAGMELKVKNGTAFISPKS